MLLLTQEGTPPTKLLEVALYYIVHVGTLVVVAEAIQNFNLAIQGVFEQMAFKVRRLVAGLPTPVGVRPFEGRRAGVTVLEAMRARKGRLLEGRAATQWCRGTPFEGRYEARSATKRQDAVKT